MFPLLEERARERGGYLKPSVYIYSTPHPNPPLKGEGVKCLLDFCRAFYRKVCGIHKK
jgi:hypothetical protein